MHQGAPGIEWIRGTQWAEASVREALSARVSAVPPLRTMMRAAWSGRLLMGMSPTAGAMLRRGEWCERNGRWTSAIQARTIARHSLSRREWRRRSLVGAVDDV